MTDTTTSAERSTVQLIAAIATHSPMAPLWVAFGAILGGGLVEGYGEAPAFAVVGLFVAVWAWLLVKLVQWWREGREPLWSYPLRWVLVQGFIWTLLFPRVRRAMAPKRDDHD